MTVTEDAPRPEARLALDRLGREGGVAPPLLLVHGYAGDRLLWQDVEPYLTPRHRLLAVDLPGHGGSPPAPGGYGLAALAAPLAALLAEEEARPAVVVGHSLGVLVAMELARTVPERVAGLVLANPPHLERGVWVGHAVRRAGIEGPAIALMRRSNRLAAQLAPSQGGGPAGAMLRRSVAAARVPEAVLAATLDTILDHDLATAASGIRQPSLVIGGRWDYTTPLSGARDAARRLPNGRLVVIPRTGHHPMLERPAAFGRLVVNWLAQSGVGTDRRAH